jgi:hypothetical protein
VNIGKDYPGVVTGISGNDWMLEILGNSLCAAGQMIGLKSLYGPWVVFE